MATSSIRKILQNLWNFLSGIFLAALPEHQINGGEELDSKILSCRMTPKIRKRFLLFLAFCHANVLGQLFIVLGLVVTFVLSMTGIYSPGLSETFGYYLLAYGCIFLLLMAMRYVSLLKRDKPLSGILPTVKYTLMPNYIRIDSGTDSDGDKLLYYQDIGRIRSIGRNIFLQAQEDRQKLYFIIPSETFELSWEFREVKKYLKDKVIQLGRPELREERSVLGSFFRGFLGMWGRYLLMMLKLLAVLTVLWLAIVFVMWMKT